MDLILSDEERQLLRGLLQDYLPELRYEVARTEAADLRHLLARREALCERLLADLSRDDGESAL